MPLEHDHQPSLSTITIPTEIIVEILLRLPVESVLRCKSVCMSWCSLISDPHFINSHLAISTRNNNQYRLVFSTGQAEKLKTCNLHHVLYDNNSINNVLELDYPSRHLIKTPTIVGCCNGLVCIAVYGFALYIWNPSTRKSNRLPPSDYKKELGFVMYGFGYQESTDDYKVVELSREYNDKRETFVKIYSLKTGNWKEIDVFPRSFPLTCRGNFSNGALHWATKDGSRSSWAIVSLDLEKEAYMEVLQSVYDEGDVKHLALGSLRERLCVLCDYPGIRADLWVMKVYGVKDSWAKLVSIPYLTDPGRDRFLMPLCMSNDGKFLLPFGFVGRSKLIVYDSNSGSCTENQNFDECLQTLTAAGLRDR